MRFAPVPAELRERCDEGRDLRDKAFRSACYAPFGTFELDPLGFVLPCCMNNAYPLGNVTEERLTDIWRGRRAAMLREALEHAGHEKHVIDELTGGDYRIPAEKVHH